MVGNSLPNLLAVLSLAVYLFQGAASTDLTGFVAPLERLTLVGALVIAVRVLWVANARKDAQVIEMASKVTETMVSVMAAVAELRKATEELGAGLDNLADNIAALTCARREEGG
jgi:hypothetical protein